jgi:hypothetical protein
MTLTTAEKLAGRAFRAERQAALDALNEASPPGEYVLVFWRVVRHACKAVGGASIGISLRAHCVASPEYQVCYCGAVGATDWHFPHDDCDGGKVIAADGRFTWTWKEGKCSGCGQAVRTRTGRLAVAADRAGHGGQAGAHHRDPRLAWPGR